MAATESFANPETRMPIGPNGKTATSFNRRGIAGHAVSPIGEHPTMTKAELMLAGALALGAGYAAGFLLAPEFPMAAAPTETDPAARCMPDQEREHLRFDFTPLAEIEAMATTQTPNGESKETTSR